MTKIDKRTDTKLRVRLKSNNYLVDGKNIIPEKDCKILIGLLTATSCADEYNHYYFNKDNSFRVEKIDTREKTQNDITARNIIIDLFNSSYYNISEINISRASFYDEYSFLQVSQYIVTLVKNKLIIDCIFSPRFSYDDFKKQNGLALIEDSKDIMLLNRAKYIEVKEKMFIQALHNAAFVMEFMNYYFNSKKEFLVYYAGKYRYWSTFQVELYCKMFKKKIVLGDKNGRLIQNKTNTLIFRFEDLNKDAKIKKCA